MAYLLALDQGTSSSRSILFDHRGNLIASAQQEFTQHFPLPGWVEHDAMEIWQSQLTTIHQVLNKSGIQAQDIAAIGITNQRETTVVWHRKTGQPICRAIVWQDRRTADWCDDLRQQGYGKTIQEKTGLLPIPISPPPKSLGYCAIFQMPENLRKTMSWHLVRSIAG